MGGIFDRLEGASLTKPALVGQNGQPTYYSSNQDALNAGTAKISAAAPTVTVTPPGAATVTSPASQVNAGIIDPTTGQAPAVDLNADQPPQMTGGGGSLTLGAPASPLPMFKRPTFQEASTDPSTGMPQAQTPGLTKVGKLVQILGLAAKGGMAGQAASNEAVIQSGGHRSGGAGIGFMAGLEEPEREAQMHNAVVHSGLENQLAQANISAIPALRAATLAHTQAETGYLQQHTKFLDSLAQIKDKDKLAQMHADAVAKAVSEGRDPQQDPQVVAIQDAITSIQRPSAQPGAKAAQTKVMGNRTFERDPKTGSWNDIGPAPAHASGSGAADNEFRHFMAQNPDATVEDYWQARAQNPHPAARGQFAAATVRRDNGFRALKNQYTFRPEAGQYQDSKTAEMISPEEYTQRKQAIQDSYEQQVADLTGDAPDHVAIPVSDAQGKTQGGAASAPSTPAAPANNGKLQIGQTVNVSGKPYKITGFNPKTGKPIVQPVAQ